MTEEVPFVAIAAAVIFIILLIYIVFGSYLEEKKFIIGNESTIAIVCGLLVSLIVKYADQ